MSRRHQQGRPRNRLQLQQLESRRLLTTLTVTTTSDAVDLFPGDGLCQIQSGECSLRAAIQEANALGTVAGPHEIVVPQGTYELTIPGTDEDQGQTGDLNIRTNLSLIGAGASATILDAGQLDRVIDIAAGTVVIRDMTIRGGRIDAEEEAFEFIGGGIRNQGDLSLLDSVVTGNTAGSGAGIANYDGGTLKIERSVITGNGDSNTTRGGGVFNYSTYDPTQLQITESTIEANQGRTGAGVMNFSRDGLATTVIQRSTISGNVAFQGGGVANRGIILYDDAASATLSIRASTISGNTAEGSGGGVHNDAFYGAAADADILNSTLTANSATGLDGGGIHSVDSPSTTTVIRSTVVAGNASGRQGDDLFGESISGTYNLVGTSAGHLLVDGVDHNLVGVNPGLGPLDDNGGPTKTHLLLDGSPAIDQGINSLPLSSDQRGFAFLRRVDLPSIPNAADGTDIGAVEVGQVASTFDFGDAPDGVVVDGILRHYPTRDLNQGARHRIAANGPFLGDTPPDAEVDGASSQMANGDDLIGMDDEDSIASDEIRLTPGQALSDVIIRHDGGSSGALLNVWLDLNGDGDWDDIGEHLVVDRAVSAGPGLTSLASVTLPDSATEGTSFLRVRLSTAAELAPSGSAPDGEIEDYRVVIGDTPNAIADLSLTQTVDNANPQIGDRVTFTITVSNEGPDTATEVEVTNLLPPELFFERAIVSQGTYEFEETWFVGTLAPGAAAELRIEATVDTSDSVQHVAEITASDQPDPDSTPGNGISGEDDQASITLGTCLSGGPLHVGANRLTYSCASPGGWVGFVHGTTRGPKTFDQYDVTVDIADAEGVAIAIATSDGVASAVVELSEADLAESDQNGASPLLLVQAFEMLPRRSKSNTLAITQEVEMLRVRQLGSGAEPITRDVIQPAVQAAMERWLQLPLTPSQQQRLVTSQVVISNLPHDAVARAIGRTIVLDVDAAGHGWFVDAHPEEDWQSDPSRSPGQLRATGGIASQRIDLVSTLIHELGHTIGLSHYERPGHFMYRWIEPGIRRLPAPDTNPILANDVNLDGEVSALDALQIINWLGRSSLRFRPDRALWLGEADSTGGSPRLDANGDYRISASDALSIINSLARPQQTDAIQGEDRESRSPSVSLTSQYLAGPTNAQAPNSPSGTGWPEALNPEALNPEVLDASDTGVTRTTILPRSQAWGSSASDGCRTGDESPTRDKQPTDHEGQSHADALKEILIELDAHRLDKLPIARAAIVR